MADPGHSTDDELAHLLENNEEEEAPSTWLERIANTAQEPLTPLTQLLLVMALVLLVFSSVFIGLFIGAEYQLGLEKRKNSDGRPTVTITATNTEVGTTTTTWGTTATETTTATTIGPPIPLPTKEPEVEICATPQCILLSASILSSLDVTKDPCEQFYDFANDGWIKSQRLTAHQVGYARVDKLYDENKQLIQDILLSNYSVPPTPSLGTDAQVDYDALTLGKMRALYNSCIDEEYLGFLGKDPLMRVVRTIRRLFREEGTEIEVGEEGPLPGQKLKGNGLTAAVAFLHSRGIDALFGNAVEGDVGKDPDVTAVWLSQPNLGLSTKDRYEDEATVELYRETIERLLLDLSEEEGDDGKPPQKETRLLLAGEASQNAWPPWPWPPWGDDDDGGDGGDDKKRENKTVRAHRLAKEVVEFETKIARASLDLATLHGSPEVTYNRVPFSNFTVTLPQIHLAEYLAALGPRAFPADIILTHPPFFTALSSVLAEAANDTVEAYLITRTAHSLATLLGRETEISRAVHALDEKLAITQNSETGDRADFCVQKVVDALGYAVGRYYVHERFSETTKEKGAKIIADVIRAFKASFPRLDWMDKESADAAAAKADAIRLKVGYPLYPYTPDAQTVFMYYDPVNIRDDAFFSNMMHATTVGVMRKWVQLHWKRNPHAWRTYPSAVDAYFDATANEAVFPAGVMQPPFISSEWPAYLSYGAFGMIAAHEVTHAFDDHGRMFDRKGRLGSWWSNHTVEGFKARKDCIVKQFSGYTVDDGHGGKFHVDGNATSYENIGDSGLIQSYRAWKAQFSDSLKSGNEYILPGLNYTRDQLFFISFAQIWADKIRPSAAKRLVQADAHAPSRFRVDGTVYNIPEFGKAFGCCKDARLNPPPENRCLFW